MKRTLILDLQNQEEQEQVKLKGWIHNIKKFKHFAFVILRDRSGVVQLVINKNEILDELKLEMSAEVIGSLVKNKNAPNGIEVNVNEVNVIGKAYYDLLPFSINGKDINASFEKQLDYRTISLRRMKTRAVFKIQQEIVNAYRKFLLDEGFNEIHTPKIIGSETEGGSEVFMVDYFGTRTFLAQSPQFYKQMMVGAGFERVFEIGHAYRAELHSTWRHLNEYVSLDVEVGFIKDEFDLMELEEKMIKYIISHLNDNCDRELKMLEVKLPVIKEIPKITLIEAQEILLEKYDKRSPIGNIDAEGEKLFAKYIKEKYDSDFVFLTKYPSSKRPVYTMPDKKEGMTKSFDLIFKGLEITTGGQRIHDYDMLIKNIKKFGGKPERMKFYTETFKYGMPPHGGFAIGLERITMMLLDLDNIRKATLIPRDINRVTP